MLEEAVLAMVGLTSPGLEARETRRLVEIHKCYFLHGWLVLHPCTILQAYYNLLLCQDLKSFLIESDSIFLYSFLSLFIS